MLYLFWFHASSPILNFKMAYKTHFVYVLHMQFAVNIDLFYFCTGQILTVEIDEEVYFLYICWNTSIKSPIKSPRNQFKKKRKKNF